MNPLREIVGLVTGKIIESNKIIDKVLFECGHVCETDQACIRRGRHAAYGRCPVCSVKTSVDPSVSTWPELS